MPTVLIKAGFRFGFWASDLREPPHIHAVGSGGRAKIWLGEPVRDGREVAVPLEWFPRLKYATPEQRARVEIQPLGGGLPWPLVDEDIEASALLSQGQIVVFGEGDYLIEDDGSLGSVPTAAARA